MKEVENVLRILQETKDSIQTCDTARIKNLSNQTINTASLTKDPDNIAVAVQQTSGLYCAFVQPCVGMAANR